MENRFEISMKGLKPELERFINDPAALSEFLGTILFEISKEMMEIVEKEKSKNSKAIQLGTTFAGLAIIIKKNDNDALKTIIDLGSKYKQDNINVIESLLKKRGCENLKETTREVEEAIKEIKTDNFKDFSEQVEAILQNAVNKSIGKSDKINPDDSKEEILRKAANQLNKYGY